MPSNRLKLLVLAAIGLLVAVVAGLGVVLVSLRGTPAPSTGKISIEVSDMACTPNAVTVSAGAPSFAIKNTSSRAIEWEILNGVLVVAERENVVPGFTVELTPRLEPGTYQMTCGLLSNPKGTLTVTAADGAAGAVPAAPKPVDLVAPTAEYRVYAIKSADELTAATAALLAAVRAGDSTAARARLSDAVTALGHLSPILHLFERDANPLTSGPTALPALRRALVATSPADSLAWLADVAAKSAVDLGDAVHSTTAAPREIVDGAGSVVAALAKGAEDPADVAARIAGVGKVIELFRPLTLRADKALAAKLDADLAAVAAAFEQPAAPSATTLQPHLADLGADLIDLLAALGLNAS
ncbi:MAG: cupredoxin domain-containing protein [Devosia sp.]|nr:cupredoxin domain-containing protein [Devosia sp.]